MPELEAAGLTEPLQPTGIYAAIYVEPIGRHAKFFDQFNSRSLRERLADGNMHVSAQYPREIIDHNLPVEEYDLIPEAAALAQSRLGRMGLFGMEFRVDAERGIRGKKRWWTVEVDEHYDTLFNQCRRVAATAVEEVFEEAGATDVGIAHSNPEGYHVSLVHRGSSNHNRMKVKIAPPLRWRIMAVGVIQSTISTREAADQLAAPILVPGSSTSQIYANRPRNLQSNPGARR